MNSWSRFAVASVLLLQSVDGSAAIHPLTESAANITIEQFVGIPDLYVWRVGGGTFPASNCVMLKVAAAERNRFIAVFLAAKATGGNYYVSYDDAGGSNCNVVSFGSAP